jgi:multifunctional beta-oxidation protein
VTSRWIVAGGSAVANTSSVTDGAAVIQSAISAFGGVSILINNAGILRDKGLVMSWSGKVGSSDGIGRFKNMTDAEFDQVISVHLKGAFSCTKAAWPHFRNQKFGRIINTASAAGIHGEFLGDCMRVILEFCTGNFGQANYSAAKMSLIGFTKSLAREGAKYNISAVAIAPVAASAMTATIMSPEMLANLKV